MTASPELGQLESVLATLSPACVALFGAEVPDDSVRNACQMAQDAGAACLLVDDPARAHATGCDGVHLTDPRAYRNARDRLGRDALVGAACRGERHGAMEAAERGADYVLVGDWADSSEVEHCRTQVEWWSTLTTIPCVAAVGPHEDTWPRLLAAGADFLAIAPERWDPPQPVAAAGGRLAAFLVASPRSS